MFLNVFKIAKGVCMGCLIQLATRQLFFLIDSFTFSLGFITDGNSFLLGNVLLRQIRIPNDTLFPVSLHERGNSQPQHQEDRENYGVGWGPPDTNITETDSIWHYQNQELLGGYPIQGEFTTYSGGGYVVRLGRNSSAAARWVCALPEQEAHLRTAGNLGPAETFQQPL